MAYKITFDDFLATEQEIKICQAGQLIQQLAEMEKELEELRNRRPIWRLLKLEKEKRNEHTKRHTR